MGIVSLSKNDLLRLNMINGSTDGFGISLMYDSTNSELPMLGGGFPLFYEIEHDVAIDITKSLEDDENASNVSLVQGAKDIGLNISVYKFSKFFTKTYCFDASLVVDNRLKLGLGSHASKSLDMLIVMIKEFTNGRLQLHDSFEEALRAAA